MDLKKHFKRKVLGNGVTLLFEKRDVPIVSVAFAVRQGAINEDLEEKGISHFLEHMLFKGTPTRNSFEISSAIEKKGGDLNGFTDEEVTAYWCKMPNEHLGIALDVLSDVMKNPLLDKNELEKERQVIFEEIKMYKDNPTAYVFEGLQRELYEGTLSEPIIGSVETLKKIDRKKMKEFFDRVYRSENMIVCVVGNVEFSDVENFLEKNFQRTKGEIKELEVKNSNGEKLETRKGIDQANMVFAYHVPKAGEEKSYAAEVLSTLMAGGMSSRLWTEIREKRNLAYAVKGSSQIRKRFGYNYVYVGTSPENVDKVKKVLIEEFEKVSKSLGEKELEEAKEQIVGNYKIEMEESRTQMVQLIYSELEGDAKEYYNFGEKIKKVKLEDVKKMAADAVKKHSWMVLVPEKGK